MTNAQIGQAATSEAAAESSSDRREPGIGDRGPEHAALAYMPQLDGLRAIAVSLVLLEHWIPPRTLLRLIPSGALGVHLFFVLSGFLITSILLRCRDAPPGSSRRGAIRAFYARRFLRIVPVFYALLAVLFLCDVTSIRQTIWWHVAYLSNLYLAAHPRLPGQLGHFWSLAAEEQFYLCLPWVLLFCPTARLGVALALVPAAGFLVRFGLLAAGFNPASAWLSPAASCDTLGCGSLLAWLAWRSGQRPERNPPAVPPSLALLGLAGIALLNVINLVGWFSPMVLLGPSCLALCGGWFVSSAARGFPGGVGRVLESPPIVYLGRVSYGVYLFHNFAPPAYRQIHGWLGLPAFFGFWWLRLPLFFVMTLAVASLSWRYFEKPLLDLKRFLAYERG